MMRFCSAMLALLLAVAFSACGTDEQTSESESGNPPPLASESLAAQGAARQAAAPTLARADDSGLTTVSGLEGDAAAGQEEASPAETANEKGVVQESGPRSRDGDAAWAEPEIEEAELEAEEPPRDLTDVPPTVVRDADVRVRPGLPWRVIERLAAGEPVLVRQRARGWLRIRHGDDSEGWIRGEAVDLGEINESELREQPAPPITAEWHGVEYGVMGQSADGTEVRLLRTDDERSAIVSAPVGEVVLLVEDITLDDLPVWIGDETVVFPGDDFRAGQGEILPQADEWMWLPQGWLLAHNDEYIWQWRPETNELEFVRRAPGFARFSPGGESLAILTCGGEESCYPYLDVTILPLDGTPMTRLLNHAEVSERLGGVKGIDILSSDDFMWTSDRRGLLVPLVPEAAAFASAAALLHAEREIVIFDPWPPSSSLPEGCRPAPSPRGLGWRLGSNELVEFGVFCENDAHYVSATYDAAGQTITLGEADSNAQQFLGWDDDLLSADESNLLGEGFRALPNETEQLVFVAAPQGRQLLIYETNEGLLRPVADEQQAIPVWFWESAKLGSGSWDTYWSEHGQAVVVARRGQTHVAGVLLVDLASGIGDSVEIGAVQTWPCYPTGSWSPNGATFQIEFDASSTSKRPDRFWIDGTAAPHGKIAQRQFVSSNGETLGVLRAIAHLRFSAPSHLAGWSPDGDLVAIGGHQNQHHCW